MAGRHRKHGPGFLVVIGASLTVAAVGLWAGIIIVGSGSSAPPHPALSGSVILPSPHPQRSSLSSSPASTSGPVPPYVAQPGDSLWSIGLAQCGSGQAWQPLYVANQAVIGPDPTALTPGTRLVISCGPYHLSRPLGGVPP